MPYSSIDRRLTSLAQERSATMATEMHHAFATRPLPGHEAKVRRAFAVAVAAGISPDDAYPVVLRALASVGLMLRPIHFMPAAVPAGIGALIGFGILGIGYEAIDAFGRDIPGFAAAIASGPLWVTAGSAVLGIAFAMAVRLQARRARLPRWSDI
jgi:hypothetical protein